MTEPAKNLSLDMRLFLSTYGMKTFLETVSHAITERGKNAAHVFTTLDCYETAERITEEANRY